MAARSSAVAEAIRFGRAWLRGCAQIAFCDSPQAGALVMAGIALVAPLAGLGTAIGSLFGTVVGRATTAYPREEWAWGLAGFNPAIVGLMWGGFFASGGGSLALLAGALSASVALDIVFRRFLARFRLPALSSGALATLVLTSLAFAPSGAWFWVDAPGNDFVPFALAGALLIVVAAAIKSPFAAAWASLLGAAALTGGILAGHDPRSLVGLWGITVPLASFGVHAVFLRGSLAGCAAGTLAALLGALIWIAWQASPAGQWLPPLVMPFILGVWLSMAVTRFVAALRAAQPARWRAAGIALAARREGRAVVALIRQASDAPLSGFVSGTWIDPLVPRATFEADRLRLSQRVRRAFFDAVDRLRTESRPLGEGALWRRVSRLQAAGCIDALIVQDVVRPPARESNFAELSLHGDLDSARCLDCGARSGWPPMAVWRRCDLRCAQCQGPVSPDVTVFGGGLDAAVGRRLDEHAARCGLVLVLGDEAAEPATLAFLENARAAGSAVVFASGGGTRYPRRATDLSLDESADTFLAFLERASRASRVVDRLARRRARPMHEPMGAAKQRGAAGA